MRVVIIGAGPTGLGAALRLEDLGHSDWTLLDSQPAGGLSTSFLDDKGFTWDLGGHVIFSHYQYFDDLMDYALGAGWNEHQRESWCWVAGTWVPYPFQNNIHRLPPAERTSCLMGLLDVYKEKHDAPAASFEEYFTRQFGKGIVDIFMRPYNFKVWAVPPSTMSCEWTGERVATVDVKRVCRNLISGEDDVNWGPNATFRFPKRGGTGSIYRALASKLPAEKLRAGGDGNRVVAINAAEKTVTLLSGEVVSYGSLISTMPIDELLRLVAASAGPGGVVGGVDVSGWPAIADKFVFSATNVIGLGIKGTVPAHLRTKCWMYFPEANSPFYRATVFSNYSEHNAPVGHWSLMLEVSESVHKPVNLATLMEDCIQGCLVSDLLTPADEIVSKWSTRLAKGYPTPFIGRNALLDQVQPHLRAMGIYSRGRFGGWKYEVANQDHSVMQGVEAVEHILGRGEEITYVNPNHVNTVRDTSRRHHSALAAAAAAAVPSAA